MADLHNQHDRIFRKYFRRPDVARSFVEHYVPGEVVALLDLDSLEVQADSFIDDELVGHYSDLLYRINLKDGRPTYIYLLFDHKSYVDSMVAYQLLDYIKQIWDKSLKEQRAARKEQSEGEKVPLWLPPIIPLVVYHGVQKWTVSREFIDLFTELPEALRRYTLNFQYRLWDLSDYSGDEIKGAVLLRVVALLLKYIYADELEARLPEILSLLRELADKQSVLEHLRTILRYVSGGKAEFSPEELKEAVDKIFEGETEMQTFFEKQLEQAHQEGERQTHIKNIKQILAIRFRVERENYDALLREQSLPQLETLLRVALMVADIAEFDAAISPQEPPPQNEDAESPSAEESS